MLDRRKISAFMIILMISGTTFLMSSNQIYHIIPEVEAQVLPPDSEGNLLWSQTYGSIEDDGSRSVQVTSDGGYIIAGYTWSFGVGEYEVYLVKTDSEGNLLWSQTYGGQDGDRGYSVQVTSDGGYIITGETSSFGAGLDDVYLVKIKSSSQTDTQTTQPPSSNSSPIPLETIMIAVVIAVAGIAITLVLRRRAPKISNKE
jgi:hypothetical protein